MHKQKLRVRRRATQQASQPATTRASNNYNGQPIRSQMLFFAAEGSAQKKPGAQPYFLKPSLLVSKQQPRAQRLKEGCSLKEEPHTHDIKAKHQELIQGVKPDGELKQ